MSGSDPLAPVARLARRVPGYPTARRVLLPRVRSSPMFRALAHKLWVTEVTVDGRGADLTAGNLLAGVGEHTLPVILFSLAEVPAADLESVVDEVASIQLLTAGFRPVLLFSQPDFGPARRYGYPAELAPDPEMYRTDLVRHWQRLRATYGTVQICEIPESGLTANQRALLLSLAAESTPES